MATAVMGDHELEMGSNHLVELKDSSDLVGDPAALRERFDEDGYLFIRGFYDPNLVEEVRRDILEDIEEEGYLDSTEPLSKGIVDPDWDGLEFDMSGTFWTHTPNSPTQSIQKLTEGDHVMDFFQSFLSEIPLAYDMKVGRAQARGGFTEFHVDHIFMNRGTDNVYSVWRPIGECPIEMGPLLICPGSHRHERLQETYAELDVDQDAFEWQFSDDPFDVIDTIGGPLATADFRMGDALIFSSRLLHGSLANQTDRFRISVDNRYQSVEEPVDGRWVGAEPIDHYNFGNWDNVTPMSELREEWGI